MKRSLHKSEAIVQQIVNVVEARLALRSQQYRRISILSAVCPILPGPAAGLDSKYPLSAMLGVCDYRRVFSACRNAPFKTT